MIFSLDGFLSDIFEDKLIISVAGIGYEVFVPERIKRQLPAVNEPLKLFTYHHIREDQQLLFGFQSLEDKQFFCLLISVSGVGPKVGLKMLSDLTVSDIAGAIINNSITTLTQISGVGKKMAERLIIELKDKVASLNIGTSEASFTAKDSLSSPFKLDLTLALKSLGYNQNEIDRSISLSKDKLNDSLSIEEAIKLTLKTL